MNSNLYEVLSSMTDSDTGSTLINVLPERTIKIANALLRKGTVTGYFRDYAFFNMDPDEFTDIMESVNKTMKLSDE